MSAANNAIDTIAIIRAKHQPEIHAYLERRMHEGKTAWLLVRRQQSGERSASTA